MKDNYRFTFGKGSPFKVQWARLFSFHFWLDDEASGPGEVDMDASSFFSLHTILFVLGGVVVDFRASSFRFHTVLFFLGGVETTFGASSFVIYLIFFCSGLFLISLFFFLLLRLSTSWGWISTSLMPCGFGPHLIRIMEHCSCLGRTSNFSSLPLILKRISPAPTTIYAPIVLKKGRPRLSGDSFVVSMSSTTKSTGTKYPRILIGMSSAIPAG